MINIFQKIKNKSGESLSEVMIAALVACLGVVLFATMVSSSFHILSIAEEEMQKYYAAENNAEKKDTPLATNVLYEIPHALEITGISESNDFSNMRITIYGGEDIMSYTKE